MSRGLTEQFTQLLFDNDVISGARNQDNGSTSVYAHYPNGSKLRVKAVKTDLVHLEETTAKGALKILSLNAREALEYVKRWSLDLEGGVFVNSMDEAYSAARNLLDELRRLEGLVISAARNLLDESRGLEGVDTSAVDVKKFTAYITYPRVGNYTVHGLLLKLPAAPSHLQEIVRACTYED